MNLRSIAVGVMTLFGGAAALLASLSLVIPAVTVLHCYQTEYRAGYIFCGLAATTIAAIGLTSCYGICRMRDTVPPGFILSLIAVAAGLVATIGVFAFSGPLGALNDVHSVCTQATTIAILRCGLVLGPTVGLVLTTSLGHMQRKRRQTRSTVIPIAIVWLLILAGIGTAYFV